MNILQILPELNVGGVETGTVDFAKYIVNEGHKSVVISNGGPLVEDLENSGTKHYSLPVHKKSIFSIFKLIKTIRQIIIAEEIEIVHARSRVPAWIAYFACRKTQAEFITTCHGYYKSFFSSHVMGWAKLIIVPSQVIGRHMIEDFNVSPRRIRCIARSVDLERFKNLERKKEINTQPIIAIIGRITPLKGHEYFFKSMAKVLREYPRATIRVIGDVPKSKQNYRRQLDILIKRLGISSQVEFLGTRKDVPQLLTDVDCVVMSSVEPESFGRVIVEAQAARIPVVATKVGGVVDIIEHERTGLLVMPKDVDQMAKEVVRIVRDKPLRETLIANALQKLESEYTLETMASRTLEVYEELITMHNILVIKLSSIGDVVLVTASLKAIRHKFPKAKITCLVGKASKDVLANCPHIDNLIVYDYKQRPGGFITFFKLIKSLRKRKIDQIIDFQNNKRSHLIAFLSFPRDSYGYDNGKWGKLLSVPIKNAHPNLPPVMHQFQILKQLGIEYKPNSYLQLWPSKKDEKYIEQLFESEWLSNSKEIVGMSLSASKKWQTKNWPLEYYARLSDMLANQNIRVVITGAKEDRALYTRLTSMCKSKPTNLIGKTNILQLAALMKKCQVFITPDSAPMHVAAAMHIPFCVFFGPTDSARHIPPAKKYIILDRKLNCAPCYSARCKILTHACMKDIKPEFVFNQVRGLLKEPAR